MINTTNNFNLNPQAVGGQAGAAMLSPGANQLPPYMNNQNLSAATSVPNAAPAFTQGQQPFNGFDGKPLPSYTQGSSQPAANGPATSSTPAGGPVATPAGGPVATPAGGPVAAPVQPFNGFDGKTLPSYTQGSSQPAAPVIPIATPAGGPVAAPVISNPLQPGSANPLQPGSANAGQTPTNQQTFQYMQANPATIGSGSNANQQPPPPPPPLPAPPTPSPVAMNQANPDIAARDAFINTPAMNLANPDVAARAALINTPANAAYQNWLKEGSPPPNNNGLLSTSYGMPSYAMQRPLASDQNLKTDIAPGEKSLDNFMKTIGSYQYQYKEPEVDGIGDFFGPMAQELEKTPVGKSAVIETPRGKMVDTGRLTLVNTSAVALVHQQQDRLQQQIDQLRSQFKLVKGK